ncbi:LacI family transcriptional regulator [Geodermatophilus sp. TF02-6]|nr:LacI family transcriptional regulator [Geodermatophilus sp. TF02-6]
MTLQHVADRAGTSRTTAHYVLTGQEREMRIAEDTRRRVLRAAHELRYRPDLMARGLRTRVTRTLALVTDSVASEAYAGELVYGSLLAAAARGYLLFVCETGEDVELEGQLVEELLDRHVDAYLYASYFTREVEVPDALRSQRLVLLNCRAPGSGLPSVVPDEVAAGRSAAAALLDAGHRDGIWLVGETEPQVIAAAERVRGMEEVLGAAGARLAGTVPSAWWPESAFEQFGAFLDERRHPRAVICFNDRVAMGVYQALAVRGLRVPGDVSVVAFDDSDLAVWLRPALSSVALPHRELATTAVELLLGEGDPGTEHRVPMPLRLRESIGPPRASWRSW